MPVSVWHGELTLSIICALGILQMPVVGIIEGRELLGGVNDP